jgi:pyruvate,orthophosphate dikinase
MLATGKILGRLLRPGGAMSEAVIVDAVRTATEPAVKWIYDFGEGSRDMRELLGGKGSGIAEMTRVLGPDLVPAGFTITTEACVEYMRASRVPPEGLADAVGQALTRGPR